MYKYVFNNNLKEELVPCPCMGKFWSMMRYIFDSVHDKDDKTLD